MQNQPLPDNSNQPLYANAILTIIQSFLLLMHHFIRFNCSREEKTSILKLIRLHIPQPNLAFPSLHRFESYLGDPEQACTTWEFCDYCHNVYEDDELNCPTCDTPRFEGENQTMKHFFFGL